MTVRACALHVRAGEPQEERSFLGSKNWFRMLSCTISALPLRVYTPAARDSICPREESNRGPGRRIGRRTVSRRIARRPRGRVVRDGLGVSFRVGAAHPPLPSPHILLPSPHTSPHLYTPIFLSFSLFASRSFPSSCFLCTGTVLSPFLFLRRSN